MAMTQVQATRILLVDDEPSIRDPLRDYLTGQGFVTVTAQNAGQARALLLDRPFDLVISDIMMPGEDGLSLTRHIREGHGLPVIMLTALSEETERVVGLEIGADDYMVKPFSPRELVARIRAVLRRAKGATDAGTANNGLEVFHFDAWQLATAERTLRHNGGREIALSAGEYELLLTLLRHPRQVMSRDRLLDMVRGRDADVFDRSIDNLVSRLRRKVEDDARQPRLIKTVWGGGYVLSAEVRRSGGAAR